MRYVMWESKGVWLRISISKFPLGGVLRISSENCFLHRLYFCLPIRFYTCLCLRYKMASRKTKKTTKKRAHRATSNVFAMFDQNQIQEFKEAFNMIDQNSDGFVDKEDLHDMLASLGKDPTDEYLEEMVKMSPGPINFTMFLTLFGEKLNGTDPEDVINNAFACFDDDGNGKVHEDALKEALTTMGDRFTEDQVDDVLRDAPIDKDGYLDFVKFTHILKHGKKDDND